MEIKNYQLLEQVGSGGMARVFRAYQPSTDRVVAIKLLNDIGTGDSAYLQRFQQEAKIIANLEHKHILPIYDFGQEGKQPYLVMRYLRGGTLQDLLLQTPDQQVPLQDTLLIISQIAHALDYAHDKGIIHRDVKPSNIMIDKHGDCFLADFGIAKVLEATSHLTATGSALGTPAYMAPEQGLGKPVDARTDVYSLGVILYQMLTGKPPYTADTPYAVVLAHINEELPLPSSINEEIPEDVEAVLLKALAKDPNERYASMGDFSDALKGIHKEHAAVNVSSGILSISKKLAKDKPKADASQGEIKRALAKQGPRRRWPLVVVGVLVVGVIAAFLWMNLNAQNQETAAIEQTAQGLAIANETRTQESAQQAAQQAAQQETELAGNATGTQEMLETQIVLSYTPTASNTPEPSPTPIDYRGTVITDAVVVREGPGDVYSIINYLSLGDVVEITGVNGEQTWLKVDLGRGETGWVSIASLEFVVDISLISVLKTPSTPTPVVRHTITLVNNTSDGLHFELAGQTCNLGPGESCAVTGVESIWMFRIGGDCESTHFIGESATWVFSSGNPCSEIP